MSAPEQKVAVSRIPSRICQLQLTIPEWPTFCPSWCHAQLMLLALQRLPVRAGSHHLMMRSAKPARHDHSSAVLAMRLQLSNFSGILTRCGVKPSPTEKGIRSFSRLHANGFRTCPQHSASSEKPYQCEICTLVPGQGQACHASQTPTQYAD